MRKAPATQIATLRSKANNVTAIFVALLKLSLVSVRLGNHLERVPLVTVICLAMMSMTPVLAAPRQIEDFCFERLQHATLALRRGAWEAFMANCIADLTPTPSQGRKGSLTEDGGVTARSKGKAR
jgi:hypothetical protein